MGGGCNSRIESLQVFLTFDLYLDLDCDKNKAFSEFQKEFHKKNVKFILEGVLINIGIKPSCHNPSRKDKLLQYTHWSRPADQT